jgi:hypothetical protein
VVVTMFCKGEHAEETVSNRLFTLMNDHTFLELELIRELNERERVRQDSILTCLLSSMRGIGVFAMMLQ